MKTMFYMSADLSQKNVESIIRGFARASSRLPDLKLVLLGSGALLGQYEAIAKDFGVLDRLVVVPWSNDVGSYMKYSKALILASSFEGFALVLVEAILNDCPIITTDVGAIGGIIPKEYANIFPQDNDKILAEKIVMVVEDEQNQKEKVERAKLLALDQIPKDLDSYTKIFKESLEKTIK
ncbi:MAG: glycosyltransferase [Candidatus Paceibacterota bacterium]